MDTNKDTNGSWIFLVQLLSLGMIWVFVLAVTAWIINLLFLSIALNDAPGITVGISFVAAPVFLILASVLTYVFVGLRKGSTQPEIDAHED